MKQAERSFPLGRSMMLNVIYDTLERLGVSVKNSNSERGRIEFQTETGMKIILWFHTVYPQETVKLTITSEAEDLDAEFAETLFDEINSTISATKANP